MAWHTSRGAPSRQKLLCATKQRPRKTSERRLQAELAEAKPLYGNAFKVELAKRTITAVLQEIGGGIGMSIKSAATKLVQKALEAAPDKWMPGGTPDHSSSTSTGMSALRLRGSMVRLR